jgi:NitT/TauT family transport system substrate-binding protein
MRISRTMATLVAALLVTGLLAGCSMTAAPLDKTAETTATPQAVAPAVIRLGNLPTEDLLPVWVAEKQGLFKAAGVTVQIVPFQSAQERDAAFTAGAIDGFMGDIIAAAELNRADFKVGIVSVCLGSTPAEGRFGIVSMPGSSIRSLKDLSDIPVGTSSGTIQEYVLDGLMKEAGVPDDQVKKEEIKKVPARFELLMNDGVKAAALPEPFLSLSVKQGAHFLADDTKGANLSQTVLVFSRGFLERPEGADAVNRLLGAWDKGAEAINANPGSFRSLLVEKAKLPKPLEATYPVNTYPSHQLPKEEDVSAVLTWMQGKKLITDIPAYSDLTWESTATAQ